MIGVLFLALRHTAHAWGRSTVLAACVLVVVALPLGTRVVLQAFEASLRERAATVPVVVGAKGSRYDLVFNGLYFRASDLDTTPWSVYGALLDEPGVGAVPVNARFSARGIPIVAVTFEYFELRSLRPAAGRLPAVIGECVLGTNAARRLGLGPGDTLTSDQLRSYDITAPPSLRMSVAGVLAPARTPDDDAVFVDIESAWVLEGIAHGHVDAESVEDETDLIGRTDEHVALSGAVVEYQEITDANAPSFHIHGDRDDLPLSAVLVFPRDDKTSTILRTRINATAASQAVVPQRVMDDLIAFVVRIRMLLDAAAILLGASTIALLALIATLSYRVRADEIATLLEIGCSRSRVLALFAVELGLIAAIGAAAAVLITMGLGPAAGEMLVRLA